MCRRPRALRPQIVAAVLLCLLPVSSPRQAPAAPGPDPAAPPAGEICGSEILLEAQLARDPAMAARRDLYEKMVQAAQARGLLPSDGVRPHATAAVPIFTIPVVVHVLHYPATPLGVAENISDDQVKSQIVALNRDFQNTPNSPFPAADCQIKFCLATLPPTNGVVWANSNVPGITRKGIANPTVIAGNQASDVALKANDYLPSSQYLNIWVVDQILPTNSGIAGYATFPGSVPPQQDGIVCVWKVFGSDNGGYGTWPSLIPTYNDGKIMDHEVGHYLDLWHTFHGGCAIGDQVSDTPWEAPDETLCPSAAPLSTCAQNPTLKDPIENFMDYTNDPCRFAFTLGQKIRMHAAIATYRPTLVSTANLISVGACPSGLEPPIEVDQGQVCTNTVVQLDTPVTGSVTYAWSISGGNPANSTLKNPTTQFSQPGPHTVTLFVTDANNNVSTKTITLYAYACTLNKSPCSNWVWTTYAALSFVSGVPATFGGTVNNGFECAAQISDNNGNLLFYTDNEEVFTATNAIMPNGLGLIGGTSCHNGAIIIHAPSPAPSTDYFVFTLRSWENTQNNETDPLHITRVKMNLNGGLGDVDLAMKNVNIPLPGTPKRLIEGLTLVPHCNGKDWWLITHGADTWNTNLYVTLVTSAGAVSTTQYPIGLGGPAGQYSMWGAITGSRDGTRLAICQAGARSVGIYKFDRNSGIPTLLLNTGNIGAQQDVAFSPNGQVIYYAYYDVNNGLTGLRQMDLNTQAVRTISFPGPERDVELGPDDRLYVSNALSNKLSCVNFPDMFNTSNNNECGYNPVSVSLTQFATSPVYAPLPNQPQMCSGAQAAQFTCVENPCKVVTFTSPNCLGPWIWSSSDGGAGNTQTWAHTFANAGTYTVTLNVPNAVPATAMKTITVGAQPISIIGPSFACGGPLNYTVNGPSNFTYAWTITGGTPATATGNNVFISWLLAGGNISVTGTDPKTGCMSTATLGIEACDKCTKPPLNMIAWWPMDEASGVEAQEIVAANDAQDINAPVKAPGAVSKARQFNGSSTFLRVNDPLKLNLGTSNLSIDCWVNCALGGGAVQGIVDKRLLAPNEGYALYVKQGYLALMMTDGSTYNEYTSTATPYLIDGQWHHVAATEDRTDGLTGTKLYVDGSLVKSFPGYSGGSVDNSERLVIGAMQPWLAPSAFMLGKIDELEIFNRALTGWEIGQVWGAGGAGKCKEFCQSPWDQTLCSGATSVQVTIQICNLGNPNPQTYNVTFNGLPSGTMGAAGGCSYNGPAVTDFSVIPPNSIPITVGANTCAPIVVQINRPQGMPQNGVVSCYAVNITNTTTGMTHVCHGSIWASTAVCPDPWSNRFKYIGTGQEASLQWRLVNTSGVPRPIGVNVSAMPSDMEEMALVGDGVISLNGLPPGVPFFTNYFLAAGETTLVAVNASFTQPRNFRFYDVILEADADGDGIHDASSSIGVLYTERPPHVSGVVPPPLTGTLVLAGVVPNPFRRDGLVEFELPARGQVRLGLYDVGGRRLRTLVNGPMDLGRHRLTLDASGLRSGAYFLRLELGGQVRSKRVVLLR